MSSSPQERGSTIGAVEVSWSLPTSRTADPLGFLADLGITVVWAGDMEHSAFWVPDGRVLILNAQESRENLAEDVADLALGEATP